MESRPNRPFASLWRKVRLTNGSSGIELGSPQDRSFLSNVVFQFELFEFSQYIFECKLLLSCLKPFDLVQGQALQTTGDSEIFVKIKSATVILSLIFSRVLRCNNGILIIFHPYSCSDFSKWEKNYFLSPFLATLCTFKHIVQSEA